jgi:cell division protein FtsB
MSKFQSTISVVAALASIFGAAAAGWKLSQESSVKPAEEVNSKYETHITELQKEISDLKQQTATPPAPVSLPQPAVVKQVAPQPAPLPPLTPPPPINQTPTE